MKSPIQKSLLGAAILAVLASPAVAEYKVQIPLATLGASSGSGSGGGGSLPDTDGDGIPDGADADADGDGSIDSGASDSDGDGIKDSADADPDDDGTLENGPDDNNDGINDGVVPPGGGGGGDELVLSGTDFQYYGLQDPDSISSACTAEFNSCPTATVARPNPRTISITLDDGTSYDIAAVFGVSKLSKMPKEANYIIFEAKKDGADDDLRWISIAESGGAVEHTDGRSTSWDAKTADYSLGSPASIAKVSGGTPITVYSFEAVGFAKTAPTDIFADFTPEAGYEINASNDWGIELDLRWRARAYESGLGGGGGLIR